MSESNRFFNEKTCPQCGKVFTIPHVTRWAYKKHTGKSMKYFCCWTCLRNAEIKKGGSKVKDQDKQRIRMSPAEMQTAIEMFRNGDKGLDQFLKDHGITSIYKWKYNVKTRYGIETPEPATVQIDGPIRIETEEPEKVEVVETPEPATVKKKVVDLMEELNIRNPLQYEEFTVRAVEGEFGRYFRDVTNNGDYIDYESKDGEELSMTIEQWKQFVKELTRAAQVLGVEL